MFLSWLFPRGKFCAWCCLPVRQGSFCNLCQEKLLTWQKHFHPCRYCGRLLPLGAGEICHQCQKEMPPFERARAVGPYQGLLKKMIWAFKYQGRRSLARPLGELLARVVVRELGPARPDLVIPVPLSRTRLKARTFNQALLLAQALGEELGLPVAGNALERVKETIPQVSLSRSARRLNLAAAFRVGKPEKKLSKSYCLLVDDVLTTGTTASACTNTLLAAGAACVAVVTLATGSEDFHLFKPPGDF